MEPFRTQILQLTLLWMSAVSSSEPTSLDGVVNQNVLLQCPCLYSDLSDFSWKRNDETIFSLILPETVNIRLGFKNRLHYFLNDKGNCSVLLSDIAVADIGKYQCYMGYKKTVDYGEYIQINVTANYNVSFKCDTDEKQVYQCKASGGYPQSNIQWRLDGQPLTSTMEVHKDNTTQLYYLTSKLLLNETKGEKLECVVGNIIESCMLESPNPTSSTQIAVAAGVSVSVGMMLLFGILFGLFIFTTRYRRQEKPMDFVFSRKQRDKERRDSETAVSLKADEDV
ncbi:hypothetical protein UPYG_G00306490 [Umbra pygmaea]|uniref:Ig-like domain-containing protein n=1 Tax=Umbra pygmaea TaxID=75934 RepID=A0ABD0VZU5_UMBPY